MLARLAGYHAGSTLVLDALAQVATGRNQSRFTACTLSLCSCPSPSTSALAELAEVQFLCEHDMVELAPPHRRVSR